MCVCVCVCVCDHCECRFTGHQLTSTYPAGLVQEVQDPQLALNEVDARLVVIEVDERPLNVLTDILSLLQLEHVLSEERRREEGDGQSVCFCQGDGHKTMFTVNHIPLRFME